MSLIYSPIPLDQIFPDNLDNIEYQELDLGDERKVLVERINDKQSKIVRLISTNCNDFLDPRYQPGTLINLYYS